MDTILLGRKTYELFVDFWPTATNDKEIIADRLNEIPKIVCSNTLNHAPWGKWKDASILSGDAAHVRKLKSLPGKNIVLWGSISFVQSLMKENLIDEYHFQICPVMVGGGRSLFPEQQAYNRLHLVSIKKYDTGVLNACYQVS